LFKLWEDTIASKSTAHLNRFILITFADLKKYKYYYWFAFPAFVSKPAWEITNPGWLPAVQELGHAKVRPLLFCFLSIVEINRQLVSIHEQLRKHTKPFFIVRSSGKTIEIDAVENYDKFFAKVPVSSVSHA
jgi:ubiquitin-like modifier-activating enzyme ATG7